MTSDVHPPAATVASPEKTYVRLVVIGVIIGTIVLLGLLGAVLLSIYRATRTAVLNQLHQQHDLVAATGPVYPPPPTRSIRWRASSRVYRYTTRNRPLPSYPIV